MKNEEVDPILAEVWKAKDELAARFNYDLDALVNFAKAEEKKLGDRVVDLRKLQDQGLAKK
jgi:hypothetical protein